MKCLESGKESVGILAEKMFWDILHAVFNDSW